MLIEKVDMRFYADNLISNGDFETSPEQPYVPNGFTIFESTTQPGIPGWKVGCSGNVEMDNNR